MVRALTLSLLLTTAAQAEVPARYRQAAAEYGLPAKVVYAVALTESGLRLQSGRARPWPWTLNIEGQGHYYPTRKAAYRALKVYLDRGGRRADVGLMQIHWRVHQRLLRDPWAPLDPMFNLRVGAYLLRERWQAAGNLWQAIGHYHAPSWPERAAWYRRQVARRLGQLRADGVS
ncbi:MAG: transglycosylase SLT domain-containing protein [Gammaproteobacteria bacterium]